MASSLDSDVEFSEINTKVKEEMEEYTSSSEYNKYASDENGEGCPICLLPLCNITYEEGIYTLVRDNPAVRIINCGHIFHRNCISQVCGLGPNCICPMCKQGFNYQTALALADPLICSVIVNKLNEINRPLKIHILRKEREKEYRQIIEKWKSDFNERYIRNSRGSSQWESLKIPLLSGKGGKRSKRGKRSKTGKSSKHKYKTKKTKKTKERYKIRK